MSVPMTMARFDRVMDREYEKIHRYQFVRELVQNSLDSGATEVTVGPCWPLLEGLLSDPSVDPEDVPWSLCVCDNGSGMSVPDADDPDHDDTLVGIMGRLSDTTKSSTGGSGGHECFGVGSRLSTLPWTDSVVISYRGGEGSMVHLTRSATGQWVLGEYRYDSDTGALDFSCGDASQEWWSVIPSELRDFHRAQVGGDLSSGTMVLLLGRSTVQSNGSLFTGVPDPTSTTLWGSGSGVCNVRYLSKYLNQRYMDLPSGVSVRVYESRFREKSGWSDHQYRRVRGVRHFWDHHNQARGEVLLSDGTKVEWWLFPDTKGGLHTNHAYAYTTRVIGLQVGSEVLHEQGRRAGRGWVTWAQFGLSGMSVRNRMSLMVTPPLDRVVLDTGRTHVYWVESSVRDCPGDFPWESWGGEFKSRMPKVLRDFVSDSVSAEDAGLQARVERGAWKQIDAVKEFYPKPPKSPPRKASSSKSPPRKASSSKSPQKASSPTPSRRIILDSDPEACLDTPATYLPRLRELRIFTSHPIHQGLVNHYLTAYNSSPGEDGRLESTIKAAVYEVVSSDYGCMVFNTTALKSYRETRQHWRDMVAHPGILAMAYTLYSRRRVLDTLVAARVKGLARRKKK